MTNLWAFLLQTLYVAGVGLLLLAIKTLLKDKLSPRWQFAVWGILGLILLLPAGFWGRYALLNWPMWVEAAKTALTGSYTLTRVTAPIPLPQFAAPATLWDWLYWVYVLGVILLAAAQIFCYAIR